MTARFALESRFNAGIRAELKALDALHHKLLQRLTEKFDEQTSAFLAQASALCASPSQYPTLKSSLHTLKGTAASLGAHRLSVIAGAAEQALRDGDPRERVATLVTALSAEFSGIRDELHRFASTGQTHGGVT